MAFRDPTYKTPLVHTVFLIAAFSAPGCSDQPAQDGPPPNHLLFPDQVDAIGSAPESFRVRFETNVGNFVVEAHRSWAPVGADRFHALVEAGFYNDTRFYRVIDGFMAQFGLSGNPRINYVWRSQVLLDDGVRQSNTRGKLSFATAGPNTRTTELFVNFVDNSRLDPLGFAPFAEVVEGMETVDLIYSGYGEGPPAGSGPYAAMIHARGNEYLDEEFPELTRIIRAQVID